MKIASKVKTRSGKADIWGERLICCYFTNNDLEGAIWIFEEVSKVNLASALKWGRGYSKCRHRQDCAHLIEENIGESNMAGIE